MVVSLVMYCARCINNLKFACRLLLKLFNVILMALAWMRTYISNADLCSWSLGTYCCHWCMYFATLLLHDNPLLSFTFYLRTIVNVGYYTIQFTKRLNCCCGIFVQTLKEIFNIYLIGNNKRNTSIWHKTTLMMMMRDVKVKCLFSAAQKLFVLRLCNDVAIPTYLPV